jgi:hypothetical protein
MQQMESQSHQSKPKHKVAFWYNQGKYEQAESLYQQALAITQETLGPDHPGTMTIQKNYTALLEQRKQEGKGQH